MTCTNCSTFWASTARRTQRRPSPLPQSAPEPGRRWRLFVGAPLPEAAGARVWEGLAAVRAKHSDVRWLAPEKLHLTLVFLGSTDVRDVDRIGPAVHGVAVRHSPFDVSTGQAGGRVGGRRGGVAWLRIAHGAGDVAALATEIDTALESHAYDAQTLPRPHLTVARGVTNVALAELRAAASSLAFSWTVDRVVFFRSHTDPKGSRYEELLSVPLL